MCFVLCHVVRVEAIEIPDIETAQHTPLGCGKHEMVLVRAFDHRRVQGGLHVNTTGAKRRGPAPAAWNLRQSRGESSRGVPLRRMLRFQLLRLGFFRSNVRFDFFAIGVVVGQGGIDLRQVTGAAPLW